MNTVQPIRDMNTVMDIARYLKQNNERDYVMFTTGIYSGLRVSDILKLRVKDVRGKDYIAMREKKTKKEKRFIINKNLKKILEAWTRGKDDLQYLLENPATHRPISRQRAWEVMRNAGEEFGVYNLGTHTGKKFGISKIGTHTLRKTFGYHMYQANHDAVMLMKLFNHSDIHVTLRYIGVEQDETDQAISKLDFGV